MAELIPGLVSTIIPVHNRARMLRTAVESVLGQSYDPLEILIVDDGSTDETAKVAENMARKDPDRIRVLGQENKGAGLAREHGRVNARGEFIQYLDSDDRLMPNKFADQVKALQENPDCGVAYGITRLVDEARVMLEEPFKWTGKVISGLFPRLLVDRWWCTHTPLYRRSVSDEVGPWSDLRYSQDWEYDARVGALGVGLIHTGTLVSEHVLHGGIRQTGHGGWLDPADRVRFFTSLLRCARRAGINNTEPEMRHFSRWVFAQARQCGALGHPGPAASLFRLAIETTDSPDLKMRAFRIAAGTFGWRIAGKLIQASEKLIGTSPGPETRQQSWMSNRD